MDALHSLPRPDGLIFRSVAVASGFDDKHLARAVRKGLLLRLRQGVYVVRAEWEARGDRERHLLRSRAAYSMSVRDVALSHVSAVLEHTEDFWGLDLGRVHLTRMDGKADRRTAGASVHRGLIAPGDVVEVRDLRVTAPARSLLELTTMATVESALVSVNACLHAGTVTLADLESRYADGFFRWRDTQTTDLVLRLASPLPESVGETRAFYLMYRHGIPAPEMQYDVRLPNGESLGRLDFAWPELGIWLEFDGRQKYEKYLRPGESPGDAVFREKQREDRIRAATGWICIRITWADLGRPAWVAEQFWRAVHLRRGAA